MDKEALIHFSAGAIGGTVGTCVTCPLEVVKTRLQSSTFQQQGGNTPSTSSPTHSNGHQPTSTSSKSGGVSSSSTNSRALYRRLVNSYYLKNRPIDNLFYVLKNRSTYGLSGSICNFRTNTSEFIRYFHTTMSRNGRFQPAIVKHLSNLIKEEGFRALYKGLIPNLIGVTPSKAIYFYIYSTSKRILNEYWVPNSASVHMASAAFGGFVTATAINPIWLVKTRLQLYRGDISTAHCIKRIYEKSPYSGVFKIFGFWKGVSASYLGISETIIQFVIYEYIRNIIDEMHEPDQEKSKLFNFMLAGGTAKFTACVIAYPHEVIRTRLREESSQKRSWFSTIRAIYKDGGFRGYYRGLSVQLLRSVPNTAITMGTYETVVYLLRNWFL